MNMVQKNERHYSIIEYLKHLLRLVADLVISVVAFGKQ